MKKIKFFAVALAALTMFSCQNESDNAGDEPGKPTYASFSVRVKSPDTYATTPTDGNGVAEEQTIGKLKLFIFNGGVLETMGEVTLGADNTGTTSLKTTTGAKVIYAVANANDDMTMTVGQTLDQFKALAVGATPDLVAAKGTFVMVGKAVYTLPARSESEALANPVPVNVARAAAKAQMQYNDAAVKVSPLVKGTFTDPRYQMAQCNTKMFLPREGYGLSPKGAASEQTDADNDKTFDHLLPVKYGDATEIAAFEANYKVAASAWDFTYDNSVYMAENVNEKPVAGNTTFVVVRLKYTPDESVIHGTNKTLSPEGHFYTVRLADGSINIYADQAEADNAQDAVTPGVNAKIYDKGRCYYRLNIRDIIKTDIKEKYAVLRNTFYRINITEVNGVGGNSPVDPEIMPDPEKPVEVDAYITADITILPWTAIDMNEPLG